MNTPCVDEVEVVNEDENAIAIDQNDRKPKGRLNDPYDESECEYCGALYNNHSKRNRMENMENPENQCNEYPFRRTCCSGAEEDEDEDEEVGEYSSSLESTLTRGVFDAEVSRIKLAKLILIEKLPLKFVETEGFREFLEATVCTHVPDFEFPTVASVIKDIIEIYKTEKQSDTIPSELKVYSRRSKK